MKRCYRVYRHTAPDGKVYIGITKRTIEQRAEGGKAYKHNAHFYRAIQKYGWDNFLHEVLIDGLTFEEACEEEVRQIKAHNATDEKFGYNLDGGGNTNKEMSAETRQKISQKKRGHKYGPMSEETKAKLSAIRKQQGNFRAGAKLSEETRKRMSEAQKKVPRGGSPSEETRRKISEANKGKKRTGVRLEHLLESQKKAARKSKLVHMKPVLQVDLISGEIINTFPSIKDAATYIGCAPTSVSNVCRGKKKQCKGFKWQYAV